MFVSFNSNMMVDTSGAGTANSSGVPEFTSGFSGVHVARSLADQILWFLCLTPL